MTATTERAVLTARRIAHYKTLTRIVVAVLRGIPRFFIWMRGWLAANDKAYLIEKGSSTANRSQHHWWCYFRQRVAMVLGGLLALVVLITTAAVGIWLLVLYGALMLFGLAMMGRDKPVLVPKDAIPHKIIITDELVRRTVAEAVTGIRPEDWETVRVLGPGVSWDSDHVWWRARVELPGTVPGQAVKDATNRLMSGFGVGASQLFIEIDPENHGIVTLYGTERDPWAGQPCPSPLLSAETVNIWDGVPLVVDARGRSVMVSLLFTGWVIGAIPRMGKTNLARLLALACALDPYCDLIMFDLKGGSDYRMFEPLCRASGVGHTDQIISELLHVLELLQAEIDRRAEVLASLPVERCPEGQLTPELARDPELDLAPILLLIDEVQWALGHSTLGKKITTLLENIVKSGQFVGVFLVMATQRPDARSVPTQIRDVLGTRAALYCATREASKTVLGDTSYTEGWNAAALPKRKGVVILYGADDTAGLIETMIGRGHLADTAAVAAVIPRAVAAREKLGRLPSQRKPSEPYLVTFARQVQGERSYVPADEIFRAVSTAPEFADSPFATDPKKLGRALNAAGHKSFQMNRKSTNDKEMPAELHGRMGYNFLSSAGKAGRL